MPILRRFVAIDMCSERRDGAAACLPLRRRLSMGVEAMTDERELSPAPEPLLRRCNSDLIIGLLPIDIRITTHG